MNFAQIDRSSKKPVNLTLNTGAIEMAKEMGINLSQTVDAWLTEEIKRRYWEGWSERNKDAVAAYNARIAKHGIPLAQYRTWGQSLGNGKED